MKINPYETLKIPKISSLAEITKAYRYLALKYHPDRNPEGAAKFKEISHSYDILRDEEKRTLYDAGLFHEEDSDVSSNIQKSKLDPFTLADELSCFYDSYRDSTEEEQDIIDSYRRVGGLFTKMMIEQLIFQNTRSGEMQRIMSIVNKLLKEKKLKVMAEWERSTQKEMLDKLEKKLVKEAKEAAEMLKEVKEKELEKRSRKQKRPESMADLQALILNRHAQQKSEYDAMLDDMEKKYAEMGRSKVGRKRVRKY